MYLNTNIVYLALLAPCLVNVVITYMYMLYIVPSLHFAGIYSISGKSSSIALALDSSDILDFSTVFPSQDISFSFLVCLETPL